MLLLLLLLLELAHWRRDIQMIVTLFDNYEIWDSWELMTWRTIRTFLTFVIWWRCAKIIQHLGEKRKLISSSNIYLLYLYKCKCAKFLSSSLYSMDCFILLASFANLKFEVVHIFLSLLTLFALICYHWSRKWQSRYIEHLIIHTRLVWMHSIKINRFFLKKKKRKYISMSSTILLFVRLFCSKI